MNSWNENHDLQPQENPPVTEPWLERLLLAQAAEMVATALIFLPWAVGIRIWIPRLAAAVRVYALYRLTGANSRYRKASTFYGIVFAAGLLSLGALSTLAACIFAICAQYQEYHGHAELVEPAEEFLANRWRKLFSFRLVAELLVSFGAVAGVVLGVVSGMDTNTITSVVMSAVSLFSITMQALYVLTLHKSRQILS